MSKKLADQEDYRFAFTDQDFERRYSTDEETRSAPEPGKHSLPAAQKAKPLAVRIRIGNSFMRARRRRLSASGQS